MPREKNPTGHTCIFYVVRPKIKECEITPEFCRRLFLFLSTVCRALSVIMREEVDEQRVCSFYILCM